MLLADKIQELGRYQLLLLRLHAEEIQPYQLRDDHVPQLHDRILIVHAESKIGQAPYHAVILIQVGLTDLGIGGGLQFLVKPVHPLHVSFLSFGILLFHPP